MTYTPRKFENTAGDVRVANTAARAVQLEFAGYAEVPVTRADLQAQAKELGIPANQSTEDLATAIEAATADSQPSALNQVTPGNTAEGESA